MGEGREEKAEALHAEGGKDYLHRCVSGALWAVSERSNAPDYAQCSDRNCSPSISLLPTDVGETNVARPAPNVHASPRVQAFETRRDPER
ncbi:unnamed protein product [Lota lota]